MEIIKYLYVDIFGPEGNTHKDRLLQNEKIICDHCGATLKHTILKKNGQKDVVLDTPYFRRGYRPEENGGRMYVGTFCNPDCEQAYEFTERLEAK